VERKIMALDLSVANQGPSATHLHRFEAYDVESEDQSRDAEAKLQNLDDLSKKKNSAFVVPLALGAQWRGALRR
jgi:hypothetical protein